jgi:hypothetical protein
VESIRFFYTFLPPGDALVNFRAGGQKPQEPRVRVGDSSLQRVMADDDRLADLVGRVASRGAAMMIDLPLAAPSDPFLEKLACDVWVVSDRVVLAVAPGEITNRLGVLACLAPGRYGAPLLGVVVGGFDEVLGKRSAPWEMTEEELDRLVAAFELVFVEAYDGESFLLGSPTELEF